MYICMYICMYTYVYMYVYVCICTYALPIFNALTHLCTVICQLVSSHSMLCVCTY